MLSLKDKMTSVRDKIWMKYMLIPQLYQGNCFCCDSEIDRQNFCSGILYKNNKEEVRAICSKCYYNNDECDIHTYKMKNYPENVYSCIECQTEEATHSFYCSEHYVNIHNTCGYDDIIKRFEMKNKRKLLSETNWEIVPNCIN